jgi:hypothetical protein
MIWLHKFGLVAVSAELMALLLSWAGHAMMAFAYVLTGLFLSLAVRSDGQPRRWAWRWLRL